MSESKTSKKRLDAVEKQKQALILRKAGVGFENIARQVGYSSASGAYAAVRTALRATVQQPADEVRQLEVERLDALLFALWSPALKGDHGAIDRVLHIMSRRAALLGLDAPLQVDVRPALELYARKVSAEYGLDEAEALLEVAAVLRGAK